MAGATLSAFRRQRACRKVRGTILVAVAATAYAPTLPPCVSCAVKFPKRESHSEDSACSGPAQRLPPDCENRPSYKAQKACDGMSHASRGPQKPDRLRPRVIERRRRQRPVARGWCRGSVDCREHRRFVFFQQRHDSVAVPHFQMIKQSMTADDCGPRLMSSPTNANAAGRPSACISQRSKRLRSLSKQPRLSPRTQVRDTAVFDSRSLFNDGDIQA
jgi:hypothetical protein